MIIGVSAITCTLLYSIMLLIIYFGKERISTTENKIYSILLAINVCGLILELACTYFVYMYDTTTFNNFMCVLCNRLFVMYLLTWEFIFTLYMFFISFGNNPNFKQTIQKNKKRIFSIIILVYVMILSISIILPLYYHNADGLVYSFGPATDLLVIIGGICIIIDVLCILINRKYIKYQKYLPLITLVVLLTIAIIIRIANPGIVLINTTFAFITFLMYFTVENPDVQMIRELYKNKKIIEKSNEDTSRFVFRITQDIKNPIKQLIETTNALKNETDPEKIKEQIQYINSYSNQLDYLVNKSLNISNLDTQKIKIYETRYNSNNLFNEINYHLQKVINDNVKFNFTIDKNIPKYLYGDTIKLKQAITALLLESAKHTKEGFINLDISAIIKYNVCRLMIQIEDSGEGMDIEQVNNILSLEQEDLEQIDIDNIEENEIGLKAIKKIITILGGSLLVKSRPNEGTTFNVVLDQKIVEIKDNDINRKIENYEQTLYGNKKILVIDEDEKELAKITSLLEENDIKVSSSVYERDCIEKIRSKVKFDLIILDDEMPNYSAIDVLKELKQIEGFRTPVIVMINDNKEGIKLQYLKDGFADYIMKSKLESEIKRIVKRF